MEKVQIDGLKVWEICVTDDEVRVSFVFDRAHSSIVAKQAFCLLKQQAYLTLTTPNEVFRSVYGKVGVLSKTLSCFSPK